MRRRVIKRLALGFALALAACGEPERPAPGGTLRVSVVGALDPALPPTALDPPRSILTASTQQGLLALGPAGELAPGLARSWNVSDDGLRYLFRMRDDVRWIDGRPITAGDAVAVIKRALAPRGGHPLRRYLLAIDEVAAPTQGIVELSLTEPIPDLLRYLAQPSLAIMRQGAEPPASGPFALAPGATLPLRLIANPTFHSAGVMALGEVRLIPEPARAATARFQRGEVDLVTGGATTGLLDARAAGGGALRIEPTWGVYGYRAGNGAALADARVRRALALAIDRDALLARVFNIPAMLPASALVPPGVAGPLAARDWAAAPIEERRARALALLAEAGYGPERPLTLVLSLPAGDEHAAVARETASQWAALGVRTRGVARTPERHASILAAGAFDLAVIEAIAPAPSPAFFLAPFAAAGEPITPAVARSIVERDAVIALFTPVRWSLVAPGVSGWIDNAAGAHPLHRLDVLARPR